MNASNDPVVVIPQPVRSMGWSDEVERSILEPLGIRLLVPVTPEEQRDIVVATRVAGRRRAREQQVAHVPGSPDKHPLERLEARNIAKVEQDREVQWTWVSTKPGRSETSLRSRASSNTLASEGRMALAIRPAITFTLGGIDVDADLRVLDHSGRPILGLWAAGADAGGTFPGGYMGGLALGLVQGRIAGRAAAEATGPAVTTGD